MINYGNELSNLMIALENSYGSVLVANNITLVGLEKIISKFKIAATRFHDRLNKIDRSQ